MLIKKLHWWGSGGFSFPPYLVLQVSQCTQDLEVVCISKVSNSLTTQRRPFAFWRAFSEEPSDFLVEECFQGWGSRNTSMQSRCCSSACAKEWEELIEWLNWKEPQNVCFVLDIELYRCSVYVKIYLLLDRFSSFAWEGKMSVTEAFVDFSWTKL